MSQVFIKKRAFTVRVVLLVRAVLYEGGFHFKGGFYVRVVIITRRAFAVRMIWGDNGGFI